MDSRNGSMTLCRKELREKGLAQKALLILDNAPFHPEVECLSSDDGKSLPAPKHDFLDPAYGSRGTRNAQAMLQA